MTIQEIEAKITAILAIYLDKPEVEVIFTIHRDSSILDIFMSIKLMMDGDNYFLTLVNSDENKFRIDRFNDYVFSIDEANDIDPAAAVYVRRGKKNISFEGSIGALLLTEFAFWVYNYRLSQGVCFDTNFKNYPVLRKLASLLFKEEGYPNKLWLDTKGRFVAVVLGLEQEVYVISRNILDKQEALKAFGIKPTNSSKSQSDKEAVGVTREVYNEFLKRSIPAEVNEVAGNTDEKTVAACYNFVQSIKKKEYDDLLNVISKEITDGAYGQTDYEVSSFDYAILKKDLQIKKFYFDLIDDTIIAEFISPTIFEHDVISVQLTKTKGIEDISIYRNDQLK